MHLCLASIWRKHSNGNLSNLTSYSVVLNLIHSIRQLDARFVDVLFSLSYRHCAIFYVELSSVSKLEFAFRMRMSATVISGVLRGIREIKNQSWNFCA